MLYTAEVVTQTKGWGVSQAQQSDVPWGELQQNPLADVARQVRAGLGGGVCIPEKHSMAGKDQLATMHRLNSAVPGCEPRAAYEQVGLSSEPLLKCTPTTLSASTWKEVPQMRVNA